jgi:hypothetical protein
MHVNELVQAWHLELLLSLTWSLSTGLDRYEAWLTFFNLCIIF